MSLNSSGYNINYKTDKNNMTYRTMPEQYNSKDALDDIIENQNQKEKKTRDNSQMTNLVDVYKRTGKIPTDNDLNLHYSTIASVREVEPKRNYIKESKMRMKKFDQLQAQLNKQDEDEYLRRKMDRRYNCLKKVQFIHDCSHPGAKGKLLNEFERDQ